MKYIHSKIWLAPLVGALLTGISTMANSIEEPPYDLLYEIDRVEIRRYEPSIQAVTTLEGSSYTTQGFRRLADFIFGGNDTGQSISMTAPVQETLGQGRPEMAFTMPSEYSIETLPQPRDEQVRLVERPARTVAVIAFSGWATRGKVDRYTRKLTKLLSEENLAAVSSPSLNQYNPPWTPPFLRRNEISIEVQTEVELATALTGKEVYTF
jgi:hypothetical protein